MYEVYLNNILTFDYLFYNLIKQLMNAMQNKKIILININLMLKTLIKIFKT